MLLINIVINIDYSALSRPWFNGLNHGRDNENSWSLCQTWTFYTRLSVSYSFASFSRESSQDIPLFRSNHVCLLYGSLSDKKNVLVCALARCYDHAQAWGNAAQHFGRESRLSLVLVFPHFGFTNPWHNKHICNTVIAHSLKGFIFLCVFTEYKMIVKVRFL